ncbi:hypothetical protein PAAG_07799 [Paracoccidioides lutzii Pb01]|uniref:Uncharacterized protein n=1 Tax=Paracoccidioides lutzii (strain ATCC MYA-826 / Pb01) TaxID=502779 RepID=C1HA70_PARBA|nr:hypothetical protein PAAG_07799 [Paracoccidioides lutzii Pb01]EEH37243.2 hypothetical protein PAAG_07799 [Paracoccidioides lutzii Pb01]
MPGTTKTSFYICPDLDTPKYYTQSRSSGLIQQILKTGLKMKKGGRPASSLEKLWYTDPGTRGEYGGVSSTTGVPKAVYLGNYGHGFIFRGSNGGISRLQRYSPSISKSCLDTDKNEGIKGDIRLHFDPNQQDKVDEMEGVPQLSAPETS